MADEQVEPLRQILEPKQRASTRHRLFEKLLKSISDDTAVFRVWKCLVKAISHLRTSVLAVFQIDCNIVSISYITKRKPGFCWALRACGAKQVGRWML